MADFRTLEVWQRSHRLTLAVYAATRGFPPSELYGLTGQLRRASASIPANLAEGYGRGSDGELLRYCRIALGSANELEYHLLLARDLELLTREKHAGLESQLREVRRMLTAFTRSVRSG